MVLTNTKGGTAEYEVEQYACFRVDCRIQKDRNGILMHCVETIVVVDTRRTKGSEWHSDALRRNDGGR